MQKPESQWKHINLLILTLAACVLGAFVIRAKLETEPHWRLLPPSKENLFVQHPVTWLMGQCYAHEAVLDSLAGAAASLRQTAQEMARRMGGEAEIVPMAVHVLSSRRANADNTGWTADIGYAGRTANGRFSQQRPALLTYGRFMRYADDATSGSTTFDAHATLAILRAIAAQPHALVDSIAVAPFAAWRLHEVIRTLPDAERAHLADLLREEEGRAGSMRITFRPAGQERVFESVPLLDHPAAETLAPAAPTVPTGPIGPIDEKDLRQ